MNATEKAKYQKAKYVVKKWENEFKATTGHVPTKVDIKGAPLKIKDAYRTYWHLKTLILESTLLDAALDENATDSFLNISLSSESKKDSSAQLNRTSENSLCFKAISECTNDDSLLAQSEKSNEPPVVREIPQLSKSVWGAHLNKKPPEKCPHNFSTVKSISTVYAQKLFQGSKFNMRNPRKPRKFDAPKPAAARKPDIPVVSETSLNNDVEPKDASQCSQDVKQGESPVFNILNEKAKVVIKSTPPNVYKSVSMLQTSLSDSGQKPERQLNSGWVNRLPVDSERSSFDSGIDVKDLSCSKGETSTLDVNAEDSDSGEDLIYDSDSESQNVSQSRINLFSQMVPPKLTRLGAGEPGVKRKLAEVEETGTQLSKRSRTNEPVCSENFDDIPKHESNARKLETRCQSAEVKLGFNFESSLAKELNLKDLSGSRPDEPLPPPSLRAANPAPSPAPDDRKGPKTAKQKKLELLEKKLASGKANENFVKINIQKKVYARGKKKTTFSNFKKQKWKALKKKSGGGGGYSGGVQKCFKCGDVGHFANACRQGSVEEADVYEFEEECPLPTLEEAEEMAKEAAEKAHFRKRMAQGAPAPEVVSEYVPEMPVLESAPSAVNALYSLNPDGSLIDTPELVYEALREFGHTEFRGGQEKAVMRVLSGLSTIVTLATGTGKSLCYQLPAYIYSKRMNCITLVVSPLVSLMEDQVFCGAPCLRVACLHTNMAPKVRETVLEELKEGKLSVLLVSPEALASGDRLASSFLRNLPPIAFACVDEAHCVSQWSRNFRPSYLTVCQVLREKLGVKTILGLTATATVSTVKSIIQQFGIPPSDKEAVISDTPLPDNLLLSVSTDEDRDCALLSLLSSERFSKCSSIIVYCTRREQCDRVAVLLRTALQDGCTNGKSGRISLHAEAYHAGLSAAKRKQVQKHFMTGKLRIVVATVAFGMGINKNDIRAIIHYNMPSSFEKYVQEVGRAGRDRQEAYCHLFLDPKGGDLAELKRHIYSDTVDRHTIRKLLQMVFVSCSCPRDAQCPKHEVAFPIEEVVEALDMPQENIQTLLCYLELHETRWVKALSPAYTTCKVASYKGAKHLRQTAKTCPPLAMALAVADKTAQSSSRLEFDVVKLARAMNWDSGIVKHTLKNLEWTTVDGAPKKSGIAVELSVLGFRMMSTGNLTEEQLDSALDILHGTVLNHEKAGLDQLQTTYNAMKKLSQGTVDECAESINVEKCEDMKTTIRNYFRNEINVGDKFVPCTELENEEEIARDIRQMICTYTDRSFNGRNIARIFHGIGSPNFPPLHWGRTRYWRLYLDHDFNLLCRLATKQLILMR